MVLRLLVALLRLSAMATSLAALAGLYYLYRHQPQNIHESPWPAVLAGSAALHLILLQHLLARTTRRLRRREEELADQRFELEGLRGQNAGLTQERDLLRSEVEMLKPAQALSSVANQSDDLDGFLNTLASVVAKNLAGAQELTLYHCDLENHAPPEPRAHYSLHHDTELFVAFTPEGGQLLGREAPEGLIPARKFGVRRITVDEHNTQFHIRAELGFALPDRSRTQVGTVRLVVPRHTPEEELDRSTAGERLKAEVARIVIDTTNVRKALAHAMPQRYDSRRDILELACRLGTETEHFGVVSAGFTTTGTEPGDKVRLWGHLLSSAAKHIAQALRGHGFQIRAIKDGLTGLYNKSFMWERLNETFEQARLSGLDLSLVMVDIDHFKQVNDTYGHQTGDIILQGVAQSMANTARASDFVFRYGGEEMGFILSGQNARKALSMANRVRRKIEEAEHVGEKGEILKVTISLGVAHFTPDLESAEQLLSRADQALYHAKENGRNAAAAWGPKKMSIRR